MSVNVIIGWGTQVTGFTAGACNTSVNWGYNPNVQKIYCLNSLEPWLLIEKPTATMSITAYQGSVNTIDVSANPACLTAGTIAAGVAPASCEGGVSGFNESDWWLTSYSYSKGDAQLLGQETWSLQKWLDGTGGTGAPTHYTQGAADGNSTHTAGDAGITFAGSTTTGRTGSVAAGGVGQASELFYGTVLVVGSPSLSAGQIGNGSASMPITPLWIS